MGGCSETRALAIPDLQSSVMTAAPQFTQSHYIHDMVSKFCCQL